MRRLAARNTDDLDYPALYVSIEKQSKRSQNIFYGARAGELACLTLAAASALLSNDVYGGAGPIAAVAFLLIALCLQLSRLGRTAERRWYDARAAAESIKSASWQYAVSGEAFRRGDEDAEADFVGVMRAVLANLSHLVIPPAASSAFGATSDMNRLRGSSLEERGGRYRRGRIDDQVKWYGSKTTTNRNRSLYWLLVLVTAEAAAILAGALRVADKLELDLLGVFAALGASIVAWTQAKGHTQLAEAYSVTSHEIGLLAATMRWDVEESVWAQSVHDAEAAFSREHTMWVARRQSAQS